MNNFFENVLTVKGVDSILSMYFSEVHLKKKKNRQQHLKRKPYFTLIPLFQITADLMLYHVTEISDSDTYSMHELYHRQSVGFTGLGNIV